MKQIDFRSLRFSGIISSKTIPTSGTTDYLPEMLHSVAQKNIYNCYVRQDTQIPFMTMPDAIEAIINIMNIDKNKLNYNIYNVRAFSPTVKEFENELRNYFPDAKINYKLNTARQAMVDGWPMDIDDTCAKRDWNWSPKHNLNSGFSEYLIPEIKKMYSL